MASLSSAMFSGSRATAYFSATTPAVERLSDLPAADQTAFLKSMAMLGEAVEAPAPKPIPRSFRINLEILGNTDPFPPSPTFGPGIRGTTRLSASWIGVYPRATGLNPSMALGTQHDAPVMRSLYLDRSLLGTRPRLRQRCLTRAEPPSNLRRHLQAELGVASSVIPARKA